MTRRRSCPAPAGGWVGAVLLALAAAACGGDATDTAPPELIGRWTTTDARYADRGFDISRDSIVFHTGDGSYTAHAIESVTVEEDGNRTLYRVLYTTAPEEEPLVFSFHMDGRAEIRFRNQPEMAWSRR